MDILTKEQRHKVMVANKSKNTRPEIAIRKLLFSLGYRFRIQKKGLPGTPDIVLPKYRLAIFVNGCFWHRHAGCKIASEPKTRTDFWQEKFARNVARDKKNYAMLREMGWEVLVIWECEVKGMVQRRCIPGLPPRAAAPAARPYPVAEDEVLLAAEGDGE